MQHNSETQSTFSGQGAPAHAMSIFEMDRHNALAHAIVATIREPLVVLDRRLCVVAASGSFCRLFALDATEVQNCPFHELNGGQWDIPGLRLLLERVFSSDML